jgi:hypothetical protein
MAFPSSFRFAAAAILSFGLSSVVPASAQNVKVRVELIDVNCDNTEDITGPDEFYLVASLKSGALNKPSITKPFNINDRQTKTFPDDQKVLYEGDVSKGNAVVGGMVAFDEDYGKDWEKKDKAIAKQLSDLAAGGATAAGGEAGPIIAGILKAVYTVGDLLAQADKDDKLGEVQLNIPADGPPEEVKEWNFEEGGIGYSTWKYKVRYRIVRK